MATLSNPASASDVLNGYEGYSDTGTLIQGTFTPSTPTLSAPTIVISGTNLLIAESSYNGNFTTGYKVYIDGVYADTVSKSYPVYDLSGLTEAGTYAIRAKAYAPNFNDSALSNEETYTVSAQAKIYGVSGLDDSSPILTRTDDAVGMSWTMSNNEISSDFDSVFPYNEMVRETIDGHVFVKVPAMYWQGRA